MNDREWVQVLATLDLMWPDRQRWLDDAARRCFRLLQTVQVSSVHEALERLKGPHPPSPALLESEVSKVEAARYTPVAELPAPTRKGTVDRWLHKQDAKSVWEVVLRRYAEREAADA